MKIDAAELLKGITPGPWRLANERNGFIIVGDKSVAELWINDEVVANARLIAAAPQLAQQCVALAARVVELEKALYHLERSISAIHAHEIKPEPKPEFFDLCHCVKSARALLAKESTP